MTSPAFRRRTRALVAFAAVTAVTAAVLVTGPGYDTGQVRMHAGTVWLASNRTGEVSLVDGVTGEVRAHAPVAEPGTALSVSQQGGAAFVANGTTGELIRVDSATERVTTAAVGLGASGGLTVRPTPGVVYSVDPHSGMVASADPDTMRSPGEPVRLAPSFRPDSVVVDGHGRLWTIDDQTGDLVWLAGRDRRTRATATRTGHLAITRSQPVLVDTERGTAELLSPDTGETTRSVRPALHPGDAVAVSGSVGSSRVLIANSTRGELITCSFDTGTCARPVPIGSAGAQLGAPVEVGDQAVVPDYTTGQATVVDLAGARVVSRRLLFDEPTRFELITRDGIVFFNDPDSNVAGVLDLTGDVVTITKYTEAPAGDDLAVPQPDPRTRAEQTKKVGLPERKPGLGLPNQPVLPARPDPASPSPRASIVVKPGNRGEVGTEFELTMTLMPAAEATVNWRFGDGGLGTGGTVLNRWDQPGTYTVEAVATLGSGKKVLAKTKVTVELPGAPPHIAQLSVQRPKPVIGELVHFSADVSGAPDEWSWTVTRPGRLTPEVTARTAAFGHRFTAPGRYAVSLTIRRGTRTATSTQELTVARGAVEGWGSNRWGELDIPPEAKSGVMAIAAGNGNSYALKADGSVIAWGGTNDHGELNLPQETSSGVIAIAAGNSHGLALKADGSVVGWGARNLDGQEKVPPAAQRDVVAIAAGRDHSLALKKDGSVVAWGKGEFGRTTIPPEAQSGVVAISGGSVHSMVLKADGSVFVWGGRTNEETPETAVPPEAGRDVVAIESESSSCLALKSDGTVIAWGDNQQNQTSIPPEASDAIAISSFAWHTLALKADGSVVAWGGKLLDPEVRTVPPRYSSGVLSIAAGREYNLVLV